MVEPLDVRITSLEKQMHEVETRTLTNPLKIASDCHYMDQYFHQMNETLTNLASQMNIVEEISKNWSHMQQELTTMNTEIVAIREAQMALHNLMEGILNWLDTVVEKKPPLEESLNDKATRLGEAWDWSVFGLPSQPME